MDGYSQYYWVGTNRTGQTVRGHLHAKNMILARIALHQQGIEIQRIKTKYRFLSAFRYIRIKSSHITAFTRQLAHLLQAKIPLLQAIELLKTGEAHPKLQKLFAELQTSIQSGMPFADALQKHPQYFNPVFCHLIRAGELSGTLARLLNQLANYQEKRTALHQKIKKNMAYPLAIISIACAVTLGLLIFVVPQFQILFESFHAHLPTATRYLILCAAWIQHHGVTCLFILILCTYAFRYFYQHIPHVTRSIDKYILRLPYIGQLIQETIVARVTQTLSILLSAGLPLFDALFISAHITQNLQYTEAILATRTAIKEGYPLQRSLENTDLFPNLMTQIIGIGEASGQLHAMLTQLAEQQNETLTHKMDMLSHLFEPILMAILGLWVGGLVIALYLPIFQLGAIVA